jgi:hypothetical protein
MNPVAASDPSIVQQVADLYPFTNYSSPTQGVAAVYGDELACYTGAATKALSAKNVELTICSQKRRVAMVICHISSY